MTTVKTTDLVGTFLQHRDSLLGFILALTHDREAAEDIFQEVGIAVVQEASRKTQVDRFLPWVHEIARRRVAEYFRKHARHAEHERGAILEGALARAFEEYAPDPAEIHQGQQYLEECLEGLSPSQRDLIDRRYRDRTPLRDIAQAAGSTEGSVKVLLWRLRRQLSSCIEGKRAGGER
jgi:RNA polymerase sigma-70 factor (ECF subfamily)